MNDKNYTYNLASSTVCDGWVLKTAQEHVHDMRSTSEVWCVQHTIERRCISATALLHVQKILVSYEHTYMYNKREQAEALSVCRTDSAAETVSHGFFQEVPVLGFHALGNRQYVVRSSSRSS